MNNTINNRESLIEAGYQAVFVIINGILYSDAYPGWSCHISKVKDKIPVPDLVRGICVYAITTQTGRRGLLTIDNPVEDD